MNIEVNFSKQVSDCTIEHFHKDFYHVFKTMYPNENIIWYNNSTPGVYKSPGSPHSPFVLTIKNLDNNKYIIVSHWDRSHELLDNSWSNYGELVQLITTSGLHFVDSEFYKEKYSKFKLTPFSYMMYQKQSESLSEEIRIPFKDKQDNGLMFRGKLYGMRKELQILEPNMINDRVIDSSEYLKELAYSKICLSLDGAGIICHRDIEILSVGSVLFRPLSTHNTYNPLTPNIHYIGFEKSDNPKIQLEIILDRYNEIKDDYNFLEMISSNGLNWYKENGTIQKNVEILTNIIDLNILK